jgi:hypothetical protein
MNPEIEKIRSKLCDDLLEIRGIKNPLERLNTALKAVDQVISELKEFISQYQFKDDEEEIDFFKNIKPEILAFRIEEGLKYNLMINKPIGTIEIQLKYFEEELNARQSFFRMNNFHYQYYKNVFTSLDNNYFLRRSGPLPVPIADIPEPDTEFSTPMSYLFSKFIAYEHMQYYILEQMALLKHPEFTMLHQTTDHAMDLKWTGDSINVVELAYGLWLTGQLNNGNASLNQIVRWLETNLHVTIGIVQRRFTEIAKRKRLSITKFIDQMRDSIFKKIDSDHS